MVWSKKKKPKPYFMPSKFLLCSVQNGNNCDIRVAGASPDMQSCVLGLGSPEQPGLLENRFQEQKRCIKMQLLTHESTFKRDVNIPVSPPGNNHTSGGVNSH